MSLTMAILMLVGMWLSVAAAMLWGVLRIVRRHSHHHLHRRPPPSHSLCAGRGGMPGYTKRQKQRTGRMAPRIFINLQPPHASIAPCEPGC